MSRFLLLPLGFHWCCTTPLLSLQHYRIHIDYIFHFLILHVPLLLVEWIQIEQQTRHQRVQQNRQTSEWWLVSGVICQVEIQDIICIIQQLVAEEMWRVQSRPLLIFNRIFYLIRAIRKGDAREYHMYVANNSNSCTIIIYVMNIHPTPPPPLLYSISNDNNNIFLFVLSLLNCS